MGRSGPRMVAGRQTLTWIRPIDQVVNAPFYVTGHAKGQGDQKAKDRDLRSYCGGHSFEDFCDVKNMSGFQLNGRVGHIGQHISTRGSGCLDMTRLRQWSPHWGFPSFDCRLTHTAPRHNARLDSWGNWRGSSFSAKAKHDVMFCRVGPHKELSCRSLKDQEIHVLMKCEA